jgi:ribosomal protein S7
MDYDKLIRGLTEMVNNIEYDIKTVKRAIMVVISATNMDMKRDQKLLTALRAIVAKAKETLSNVERMTQLENELAVLKNQSPP